MHMRSHFDGCDIACRSATVAAPAQSAFDARGFFVRILDTLGAWQDRAAARRALARLDDRMLSDIGVDRATADAEVDKPFWRA